MVMSEEMSRRLAALEANSLPPAPGPEQARKARVRQAAGADPIPVSSVPAVNVASVPQRSPLRYPGGKTWLIPHIRYWLKEMAPRPKLLIEPFAGGGIVSLTAVMEGLVEHCLMVELDRDVSAFWHAALRHGPQLCEMVKSFEPTRDAVDMLSRQIPSDVLEHGFRTLVLNRTRRGGILAPGASLSRYGEGGKGVASRWYPETLIRRLSDLTRHVRHISFCEADGIAHLEALIGSVGDNCVFFVDPPYTVGGKRAGKRLYTHSELDHDRLFELLADGSSDFLMTYDRTPEIEALVSNHSFHAVQVLMKNTHHARIPELVISRRPVFVT